MVASTTGSTTGHDILQAYLPATLIGRWAREPQSGPVWHETLDGALMLCDMSGFTAMSERLADLGREGAEIMAGVLNGFFDRMLGIAGQWGGVQMKFGGDAMLLFFEGAGAVARASACALEMQAAMPEFRNVLAGGERHRLRMRVGMHCGTFFTASAGQPQGALHYLLMGPSVNRTAEAEGHAEPGQVVLSREAADEIRAKAHLVPARGEYERVLDLELPARPAVTPIDTAAVAATLLRYLMPPLAAPLAEGRTPDFAAEHRSVTAVFINVLGVADLLAAGGPPAALAGVDSYLNLVLDGLDKHGGFLGGSDAAETGDKLIILFGAPVSSEGKEVSACRFALDLDDALKASGLRLRHRIGISSGFVFAGEIGSTGRREYTVIGDSVNLAARLMASARPGQVFISGPTADRVTGLFELRRLRPLALKGKRDPVQAYRLAAAREREPEVAPRPGSGIVGRDGEISALLDLAGGDGGAWSYISGEPGIGKSRVVGELVRRLTDGGWLPLLASSKAHHTRTVFAAWSEPLRSLFEITPADDGPAAWNKLRAKIARLLPQQLVYAPLLAGMLSLPSDDEPMLQFLDARTRRQHLSQTVAGLLRSAAQERPVLLVFEDVHLADAPSLELLAEVVAEPSPSLFVCVTSRDAVPSQLTDRAPDLAIDLKELPVEAARRLVSSFTGLEGGALDAIVAKAQGNPLFLEEMALSVSGDQADLPQTINEVIMARLDHLPYEQKAVLRAASVAGSSFHRSHIGKLLAGGFTADEIDSALAQLNDGGFTRSQSEEDATHAFCHMLAQEVIYETLPYAHRREMHGAIGSFIEGERGEDVGPACGVLLHHFERAGDAPRTVRYAAMTGDRAATAFANREAIDYYGRALDTLQRTPGTWSTDRSTLLERIGESLEMEGRHAAATQAFVDALAAWRTGPRGRKRVVVPNGPQTPDAAREAVLCRRVAVSFERRSDYDQSLVWLDEAIGLLPVRPGRTAADVYASKSMSLFRKGNYSEAIEWGRRAVAMARRTRDRRSTAYAHNMLANSYIEEGAVREAVRHLWAAVAMYEEIGDVYGLAAANNNLGNCYSALGDVPKAIEHYEISLRENRRAGNDAAIVHNNIGEVLLVQGRTDEAIEHLDAVLAASETNPDLTAIAGYSQINRSRCNLARGDLAAAGDDLLRGMELLRSVGAEGLLIEARVQQAELRIAQGRPEEALSEARDALADAQEAHARLTEASAERVVGCAEAALGSYDVALGRFASSAAIARKAGAGLEEARALIDAARVTLDAGHPVRRDVRAGLRRAAAIVERMGAQRELQEAQRLLARLARGRALTTAGGAAELDASEPEIIAT